MYDGIKIGDSLQRKLRSGLNICKDFTLGAYIAQRNKLTKEANKQFVLDEIVRVRDEISRKRKEINYFIKKDYDYSHVVYHKKELDTLNSKLVKLKNNLLTFKS